MDLSELNKTAFFVWIVQVAALLYLLFPFVVWSYLGMIHKRLQNIEDRMTFMGQGQKDKTEP